MTAAKEVQPYSVAYEADHNSNNNNANSTGHTSTVDPPTINFRAHGTNNNAAVEGDNDSQSEQQKPTEKNGSVPTDAPPEAH